MSSDCCSVAESSRKGIGHCPRCGEKGKDVSFATVGAMAKTEVEAYELSAAEYKLCRNLSCPVVYFAPEISLETSGLRVPVNFKERNYEGSVIASTTRWRALGLKFKPKVIPQHKK